ncbi:MAG: DUF3870 domain-containing protein [Sporomusaceae bacterium]|nr:DUF3870 domain-containing protein [Sporomusaceae bacterium]
MEYGKDTIFITGVAKPAKDDPIASIYDVFFISLIVDKNTDRIVNISCNTASNMTGDFIRSLLIDRNMAEDLGAMEGEIRSRFFGLVQKALIVSLKDAYNRYMMVKKNK